jgi:protein gp37
MATRIEWCDETINPIVGCSKISDGCKNCYAEKMAVRLSHMDVEGYDEVVDYSGKWNGNTVFVPKALEKVAKWKKPKRIFVGSMTDIFHDSISNEWIASVFGTICANPIHVFVLLTKRPERALKWFEWVSRRGEHGKTLFPFDSDEWRIWQMLYVEGRRNGVDLPPHHGGPWPLPNLWLGVTVESEKYLHRVETLINIPAAVRFASVEPMLKPVVFDFNREDGPAGATWTVPGRHKGLSWVVCGPETGPGKRPFDYDWARDLRGQCKDAGVPFFFKPHWRLETPEDLRVAEFPK